MNLTEWSLLISVLVWLGLLMTFFIFASSGAIRRVDTRDGWERGLFIMYVFGVFPVPTSVLLVYLTAKWILIGSLP